MQTLGTVTLVSYLRGEYYENDIMKPVTQIVLGVLLSLSTVAMTGAWFGVTPSVGTEQDSPSLATFVLNSVPDGLGVFLAEDSDSAVRTLFESKNLKGHTPLSLRVRPGTYRIGYLMTAVPFPARFGVRQEVVKGARLAMSFSGNTALLHRPGGIDALESAEARIIEPNRASLEGDEEEPVVWDLDGPDDFNTFLEIAGGKLRVRRYLSAVEHE